MCAKTMGRTSRLQMFFVTSGSVFYHVFGLKLRATRDTLHETTSLPPQRLIVEDVGIDAKREDRVVVEGNGEEGDGLRH